MKKSDKTDKNELVKNVLEDFERRKSARKPFELQWQLNIDFLRGNQNNYITSFDTVTTYGKQFHWQQREVFNHIGPMVEMRLAKLSRHLDDIGVIPFSNEEKEVKRAKICEKIIKSAFKKVGMDDVIDQGNMWAEMTGTAFYKVVWNNSGGRIIGEINGKPVREGEINIVVCSPFEIYPDNFTAGNFEEAGSIIHAKPYTVDAIREIWGADVKGEDVEVYDFNRTARNSSCVLKNAAMVIERYKNGRLVIAAQDKLLYDGAYENLPFIRQTSESMPGSFYGRSVIERAIPVQRAYNAVKNRKTEFMNRLVCGVLTVEEGSVDIEALENDGLAPGTVIVYRQGCQIPKFVEVASMPMELEREEERLLREFETIAGGGDIIRSSQSEMLSGVALEIIVEQAKLRMSRALVSSRNAICAIGCHMLRLYKKFGGPRRIERLVSGRNVELFNWCADDITSEEVTLHE